MNKKNLWFLTLFSLVIVLSIYYVTMPEDLLSASTNGGLKVNNSDKVKAEINESDTISALKVEDDTKVNDTLSELEEKISDSKATTEEKNKVYEEMKTIRTNSGIEENLEKKIKEEYGCEAFAKIEDGAVKVVVDKCENSKRLANQIMRLVQEQFENKMYISVQFES